MADTLDNPAIEQGDPLADARAFRRCLGQFPTGVTIVTAAGAEGPVGVTANSFTSLSMDPPLVLWSIGQGSRSFPAFRAARAFTIHILASDQLELSQHFASKADDKFAGVAWQPGLLGAPLLAGAAAVLECSMEAQHAAGDHMMLVGRVQRYARHAGSSLVYAQGRYAVAEDHPASLLQREPAAAEHSPAQQMRFTTLLASLGMAISSAFDNFRQAQGIDLPQGRTLFTLREGRRLSLDEIVARSYLTRQSAEDALASLRERGCVASEGGQHALTPRGEDLFATLTTQFGRFEQAQLAEFPKQSLAVARSVVQTLHDRLVRGL